MADPQEDVPASSADISANNLIISSPFILPGECNQYPMNMAVDFTRLQLNALRKYMTFHDLPEVPGSSREQLAILVARHFNVECKKTDESSSITSFMTFLTGSSNTVEAAEILRSRPMYRLDCKNQNYDDDDNENQSRQRTNHIVLGVEAEWAEIEADDLYDHEQVDGAELDSVMRPLVVKKRRAVNQKNKKCKTRGQEKPDNNDAGVIQTKKRKGRLYCICKGSSYGNMIACDNKKCLDRSNWYHMSCVGLNPLDEPPETWYCPPCQENTLADIPENQYRKPVASVTYGDMIAHALTILPDGKGSFKDICDFVEIEYESQLNWKLESDQRKSPVWKSSVRKILFSNVRFQKHPEGKGMFCLAA
ncbi:unnamed protein product [Peronospora farinosa]|uniref:PHD-type domain-containing protein n=1 Tax=Peronospora farinosa TaxID=134698 RepID=A0AAV0SV39_9STRA|nr:unnamed protein product [Peronospora farinosa]CAI5706590.1 unnamed protein product [Peronospora farinosa]